MEPRGGRCSQKCFQCGLLLAVSTLCGGGNLAEKRIGPMSSDCSVGGGGLQLPNIKRRLETHQSLGGDI